MDLAKYDTATRDITADMPVLHPGNQEPLVDENTKEPVTITLLGGDTPAFVAASQKIADEKLKQGLAAFSKLKPTSAKLMAEEVALLVSATKGWRHITVDGEEWMFSPENAYKLYKRFPWIMEQVQTFIKDRANYLKN